VIFTSAQRGRPKGVMVTHRNVINFFKGMDLISVAMRGQVHRPNKHFVDISILELLWPLTCGAEIVITPERGRNQSTSLLAVGPQRPKNWNSAYSTLLIPLSSRGQNATGSFWRVQSSQTVMGSPLYGSERHFHRFGGSYTNPSVTSAIIAAVTNRIAIRAGSVVLPLHDPIRVAEEWSIVDNLSGGRVGMAIASGWHVDDFVFAPIDTPIAGRSCWRDLNVYVILARRSD